MSRHYPRAVHYSNRAYDPWEVKVDWRYRCQICGFWIDPEVTDEPEQAVFTQQVTGLVYNPTLTLTFALRQGATVWYFVLDDLGTPTLSLTQPEALVLSTPDFLALRDEDGTVWYVTATTTGQFSTSTTRLPGSGGNALDSMVLIDREHAFRLSVLNTGQLHTEPLPFPLRSVEGLGVIDRDVFTIPGQGAGCPFCGSPAWSWGNAGDLKW